MNSQRQEYSLISEKNTNDIKNIATQALKKYFEHRLGWKPEQNSDFLASLKTLNSKLDKSSDKRLKNKVVVAIKIVTSLGENNTPETYATLMKTLAEHMQEARSQQGFGYAPFTTFVHATKGFSKFSNALEKIGQAVYQQNVENDTFEKHMSVVETEMKHSIARKNDAIAEHEKRKNTTIEKTQQDINEENKKISKIEKNDRWDRECEASHGSYNQNSSKADEEIATLNKKISNLNILLTTEIAKIKKHINSLKKEIVGIQETWKIFSGFSNNYKNINNIPVHKSLVQSSVHMELPRLIRA